MVDAAVCPESQLIVVAIAEAAERLVELRDRWLNPPEWTAWVDEPAPGYPQRPEIRDEEALQRLLSLNLDGRE